MNQSEKKVLQNVIRRLKGEHVNPQVAHHLEPLRLWLDTWSIGPLELLLKEDRDRHDLDLAVRLSD